MDWIKIKSFDNLYQAEFLKELLNEQGINAVIVNNRDSMLLIGDIELYVHPEKKEQAEALINEYYGLTMIDSFILEKPVRNYQEFVEGKGIETIFKIREDNYFGFTNYELFVRNEDISKVRPFLSADNIEGWQTVALCYRDIQIYLRCKILEENNIDTLVLKVKDINYKLIDINLMVKEKDYLQAKDVLNKMQDWAVVGEFENIDKAEIREQFLFNKGIETMIKQENGKFKLYVREKDKDKAIDLILSHKKVVKLRTYNSLIDAQADQNKLKDYDINASIVQVKDSMFLLGGYDLYVNDDLAQKALKIITDKD